jgi:hypothetical protein
MPITLKLKKYFMLKVGFNIPNIVQTKALLIPFCMCNSNVNR